MSDEKKNVEEKIRSVLQSTKGGIPLRTLQHDYAMLIGQRIPFSNFGFSSLDEYLRSIPDVARFSKRSGEVIVEAVADESTEHLARLLARQRPSKNCRSKVKRPQRPRCDKFPIFGSDKNFNKTNKISRSNNTTKNLHGEFSPRSDQKWKPSLTTTSSYPSSPTLQTLSFSGSFSAEPQQFVSKKRSTENPKALSTNSSSPSPPPVNESYKQVLEDYARTNRLGTPTFKTFPVKGGFFAIAKVGGSSYSSYPTENLSQSEALECVAKIAVDQLGLKTEKEKLIVSFDVNAIFDRIREILSKYPTGVISTQVPKDYTKTYKECLPDGWMDVIVKQKICKSQKIDDRRMILYPKLDPYLTTSVNGDSKRGDVCVSHQEHEVSNDVITISEIILPSSDTWDVYVCHATSTTSVFVRLIDSADEFDKLATEMEKYYCEKNENATDNDDKTIRAGHMYAANFGECWHRVEVISVTDEKALCLFVDNGDCDFIDVEKLRSLDEKFLTLSKQAIQCQLHELEKHSNHPTALLHLHCLLIGNVFVAEVAEISDDVISLYFYDTSEGNDENVNRTLLESISKEDITPRLPKIGDVCEVYLSHVSLDGDLYVQIAGKCNSFIELLLKNVRENCENHPRVKTVVVEEMYLAKYSIDWQWYRAIVVSLEKNEMVRVKYVDFGNTEVIPASSLRDLEPVNEILSHLPYQAIMCKLHDIPSSKDLFWTAQVVDRLYSFVTAEDQLFLLKVVGSDKSTPMVELFKHIQPENQLVSVNGTLALESQQLFSKDRLMHLQPPNLPEIGGYIDVHVSMAASPSNFTCQPWSTLVELERLTQDMQEYYQNGNDMNTVRTEEVKIGNYYACKHKVDKFWYRVQVKGIDSSESVLSLFYVDFGDTVVTNREEIRILPSVFKHLPYQALFCYLADVVPAGRDWLPEDCVRFQSLVSERQFVAEIVDKSVDLNGCLTVGVKLIDTSDADIDVIVGSILTAECRALAV